MFKRAHDIADDAPTTHIPWVFVDDLDDFIHAKEGGARILQEIGARGTCL